MQFPWPDGIKCYALVSKQCSLAVDGVPEPVRVQSGDFFLLPRGRAFRLTTDLDLEPVDYQTVISAPLNDGIRRYDRGGDCFFGGGHFVFAGSHAGILVPGQKLNANVVMMETAEDRHRDDATDAP